MKGQRKRGEEVEEKTKEKRVKRRGKKMRNWMKGQRKRGGRK